MSQKPLGWDGKGLPLDVPDAAAGWRVRRSTGRQGPPQVVYDENGKPLVIDIGATADDLRAAAGGGRYRLEACTVEGRPLGGVVAFTEISGDGPQVGGESTEPGAGLLALCRETIVTLRSSNEKLTDTTCRALEAMAKAFGPVRPTTEPAPAPPQIIQLEAVEAERPDYQPMWLQLGQQLAPLLGPLLARLAPPTTATTTAPAVAATSTTTTGGG